MSANPGPREASRRDAPSRVRRVALFAAPWLAVVAVAVGGFVYLRTGGDRTPPAVAGGAPADDAGGVARALAAQGITGVAASTDASNVPGALTQDELQALLGSGP